MAGLERFRLIDAAFIIGSILTFIADQTTGKYVNSSEAGILNITLHTKKSHQYLSSFLKSSVVHYC